MKSSLPSACRSSLAALLLVVAYNMSDIKHVVHMLRVAPKSDVFVLLTCLTLTVVFDMVVSVSAGVMLAALLFMRRMAEISGTKVADEDHPAFREMLPKAHFATIYAKPAGRPMVDTFVTEVSQDTWIYLPWDMDLQFAPPIPERATA